MSNERDLGGRKSRRGLVIAVKEKLDGVNVDLTSLFCRHGANVYILTYQKNGARRHTFIDAGDSRYQNRILPMLAENGVEPANIERIIITHGHPDHYGLAYLLAKESKAKVTVQSSFASCVDGETGQRERRWSGSLDPSRLKDCDIEYLRESDTSKVVNIGGVGFVRLTDPIEIGQGGRLEIIGCPESMVTHSPDQIVVLYSSRDDPHPHEQTKGDFRPTDDIIFSGDLWLMRGPMFYHSITDVSWYWRRSLYRIKALMSGGGKARRDPRNQDSKAKEALKKGFRLIRVKPGHGPEFLGTRILPIGLLAERDILVKLGYPLDTDKSILRSAELAPKVRARREQAYTDFVRELILWIELGYTLDEMVELLVRIYTEQSGGGPLVKEDRKERRGLLKGTLARLKDDEAQPDWVRQLAVVSQSKLKSIS
jgi:glyoxylase-like metal-dependent hydrolase (beta-lactamase superfamily II)